MDYSTCVLEWNRVGKGVSMGRFFSYDINKGRVIIGEGKEGVDYVRWVMVWVMIG